MAFLFNGYQTSDDASESKQNIFGGNAGANESDGGDVAGSGPVAKTTADGGTVSRGTQPTSTGGVSRGTGGNSPPQVTSTSYNPKAIQSAYSRIGQTLQLPTQTLGQAQGQIQQGQQKLQDEANKYAAAGQQQAEGFKLDSTTLQQAAQGDKDAYAKTAGRLTQAAPTVEAFKGIGDSLPDVSAVKDASRAYAPQAGPNYTAGQSRLDAALLRRNPEYLRLQQEILGGAAELGKQNTAAIDEKTKAQEAMLQKAYADSTADIRSQVGGLADEVTTAAKAKESAEDQRRAGLDPAKIAEQEYAKLREKIREDLKGADPRSQQYRSAKYLDSLSPAELSRYVNVDKDTDWQEFIDQGGAERYNRLQGLLGSNQMLTPSQMGAGADYSFDEGNAYKQILAQITGQRQQADVQGQERISAIQAAAQQRAAQKQAEVSAQYDAIRPQYDQLRNQVILPNARNDQAPTINWTDTLSPDEIAELNSIEGDLAVLNPGNYQQSTMNPYADLKAMQDDLRRWQAMQNPTAQTGVPIVPKNSGAGYPMTPEEKERLANANKRFSDVR